MKTEITETLFNQAVLTGANRMVALPN